MISIKARTTPPDLAETISNAPRLARGRMTHAAAVYLVGDSRRGLKHYVAYKYVTRKRAFGKTFVSDRQRRLVMARIRSGKIDPGYPHRTGRMQRGFVIRNDSTKSTITNTEDHTRFVMGDDQSRHERLVGWRHYALVIESNTKGMVQEANRELVRYLNEKGVSVK